jgi:hypothetical protein
MYFLRWAQPKRPRNKKTPLHLRLRPDIALNLHQEAYTCLAAGDSSTLRKILCTSLYTKFESQIRHRKKRNQPAQTWKVLRYTSPVRLPFSWRLTFWPLNTLLPGTQAKVVADRVVPFPFGNELLIRQCIVRIRSLQSLDRNDGSPPSEVDLTEYLVMQQMHGKDDKPPVWKLWGTTQPANKEDMTALLDQQVQSRKVTLVDRIGAVNPLKGL